MPAKAVLSCSCRDGITLQPAIVALLLQLRSAKWLCPIYVRLNLCHANAISDLVPVLSGNPLKKNLERLRLVKFVRFVVLKDVQQHAVFFKFYAKNLLF